MRSFSLRSCLLLAALVFALAAQAQVWTFKGGWGTAVFTPVPGGKYAVVYNNGSGSYPCAYTIDKIVGEKIYLKDASGMGCTGNGWMTPTRHHFVYAGREGGFVDLDGNNPPLEKMPQIPPDRSGWTATSITGPAQQVVTDSSPRWTTGRAMAPGDWLQIDLGKSYNVTTISLDSGGEAGDGAHGM